MQICQPHRQFSNHHGREVRLISCRQKLAQPFSVNSKEMTAIISAAFGKKLVVAGRRRWNSRRIMDQATHNKIVSFIWGIADDVLRDLFKRGKYPDVILPMCVLRRMDAVLEPTKKAVLETKQILDAAGITEQKAALCDASGHGFYNKSPFKLQDFKARASQQQLRQDFEAYLDGFSPNVQDILDNFKFRNQ